MLMEEDVPTILVVNGPNLNLLGTREPDIYGTRTLSDLEFALGQLSERLGVALKFFQSNSEGAIIDFIQNNGGEADGMIINPAAYTHYSLAIRDAIASVGVRTVEVHLSNVHAREDFRQRSVIAPECAGQVSGLGFESYAAALRFLANAAEDGAE